jgi:hypothetical protein
MKNKFLQRISFAFKRHPLQLVAAIILAVGFCSLSFKNGEFHQTIDWLDPIVGILTLLVALLVWLIQLNIEWEDNLSKRLTVQFDYNGKIIMLCEQALLVGESDIRAWGQQIGSQMSFTPILKFDPYFKIEKPELRYNEQWKEWHKLYVVTFYLNELPDVMKAPEDKKAEWSNSFQNGYCLKWYPEYKHGRVIEKREYWDKAVPTRSI